MNSDKELVEVWQKQFEDWASDYPGDELSKKYLEQAWIAAKRTQPSVLLPKEYNVPTAYYDRDIYIKAEGWDECIEEFKARLTAAGIKYTIGE